MQDMQHDSVTPPPFPSAPSAPATAHDVLLNRRRVTPAFPASNHRPFLPQFYLPLILILCAGHTWVPLNERDDFWSHAAVGRWIWQHHEIPRHTLFLWSAKIPWVAHNWLTQLQFYGLMSLGGEKYGPYLANFLTVIIVCVTFMLLFRLWSSRGRINIFLPLLFSLALWCSAPRFHPRPELWSALFLMILLWFLTERHNPDGHWVQTPRVALSMVLMFALWANLHGGVALGLVILLLTLVGDIGHDRFAPRTIGLLIIFVLALLAVCINPYGTHYLSAIKQANSSLFKNIDEWKPYWAEPRMPWSYVIGEGVLALAALIVWIGSSKRRWSQLLWLIFISASFVMARRHLWNVALISLTVIGANAAWLDTDAMWRGWRRLTQRTNPHAVGPIPSGLRFVAHAGAIACLISAILIATPRDTFPLRATSRNLPVWLTDYVRTHKPPGRLFNDYEISTYLEWRFGGNPPLFIDMINAYPTELLNPDYFDMIAANERGLRLFDMHRIRCIILRIHKSSEAIDQLARYLNAGHGWKHIYDRADGDIWTRELKKK